MPPPRPADIIADSAMAAISGVCLVSSQLLAPLDSAISGFGCGN